jgi:hypothetical protein
MYGLAMTRAEMEQARIVCHELLTGRVCSESLVRG